MYKKLLKVQEELGAIKKDSTNPYFKSKYFDINSLLEHVKPTLNKHGLVLLQVLTNVNGKLAISTELTDSTDGKTISGVCPLPDIQDPQKVGSAVTYFRRYALQSLLALEAEDDDGNFASKPTIKQKVAQMEKENDDLDF